MQKRRASRAPAAASRPTAIVTALACAAFVVAACTPDDSPAPQVSDTVDAVLQSREALGDPMLRLAEAVITVEEGIDDARHRARRGDDMAELLDEVAADIDAVGPEADAATQAAGEASVEDAAAIVEHAAAAASDSVGAMRDEVEYLREIARIDKALLDAAEAWDRPGSQSEIRARLGEVADRLARVRARAQGLSPVPESCGGMKRNRRRWTRTVQRRTANLARQANSAGGIEFDRLRAAYRALPFSQEPRIADRRDRTCWEERSDVATVADDMRAAVDELRSTLSR